MCNKNKKICNNEKVNATHACMPTTLCHDMVYSPEDLQNSPI